MSEENFGLPARQRGAALESDRRPSATPIRSDESLQTLRRAVSSATARLEDGLLGFDIYDRVTGELVVGTDGWEGGSHNLFAVSQRLDLLLPAGSELPTLQDYWLIQLPAEHALIVVLDLGARYRGLMLCNTDYLTLPEVLGNVAPRLIAHCQDLS